MRIWDCLESHPRANFDRGVGQGWAPTRKNAMARAIRRLSSPFGEQVTGTTILKVTAGGFALVILLLLAAGFVGIRNIESIRQGIASLEEQRIVTARLIGEIQGEQAALSAVFYELSRDPATVDRDAILSDLDAADRELEYLFSQATPHDEATWKDLGAACRAFTAEARRLLGREAPDTYLSLALFHRHDQVISMVAKLIASANRAELDAQNQIRIRSAELVYRSSWLLGGCLILALLFSVLTVRITTGLFQKMHEQASELNRVSWHMLQTQETVARRFSHELHDELGQSLAALKANLAALTPGSPSDGNRLADSSQLVDEAIRNIRELSQLLRPTILDDFGLDASLRWIAERFAQRSGISVHYESEFKARLSDQTETHLYRIAQEALTNVARHSGAKEVWMNLAFTGSEVLFDIRDDGKGIPPSNGRGREGLGLVGIEARARSAGGQVLLESAEGSGLHIEVRIPQESNEERDDGEKNPHPAG
jgi:signal transduction histidine kinase